MANKIQVKIDAMKIRGAFQCRIQGRTAEKVCICIPLEHFYHGKDGAEYLDFVGYEDERQSYGRLFSLKQSLSRAEYEQLKASGNQLPFCGDIKRLDSQQQSAPAQAAQPAPDVSPALAELQAGDDLPF